MGAVHRVGLDISVGPDDVVGLLGYAPSGVPTRVRAMVSEVGTTAPLLADTRGAYRIMDHEGYSESRFLRYVDQLAVGLVTIGPRLEEEVGRLRDRGELARALVLDAYGSAMAEAAADVVNERVVRQVGLMGLRCSRRFSPGYGGWSVHEQAWILPALEADRLDVALTDGCMMKPRKSITFAVTIGEDPLEVRTADICQSCGAVNCKLRNTPHKCFGDRRQL